MTKYLHLFDTDTEFNNYIENEYVEPFVSLTKKNNSNVVINRVDYNQKDYTTEYFTIKALADGKIGLHNQAYDHTQYTFENADFYYRLNGGSWTKYSHDESSTETINIDKDPYTYSSSTASVNTMSVSQGDIIEFKSVCDFGHGLIPGEGVYVYYNEACDFFYSNMNVEIWGNMLSLIYGDDFLNHQEDELPYNLGGTEGGSTAFGYMFGPLKVVSAEHLEITKVGQQSHEGLFYYNTNLITGPKRLVATDLAESCYDNMFGGCSNLQTASKLPATTLASGCYRSMYNGCSSLTIAPELPATTLASGCYQVMFQGCTSLTTAPELLATTMVMNCYTYMFEGCSSLNYVKCMGTNPNSDYSWSWLENVAQSGTFVKAEGVTWSTDANGIPSGWTVETA